MRGMSSPVVSKWKWYTLSDVLYRALNESSTLACPITKMSSGSLPLILFIRYFSLLGSTSKKREITFPDEDTNLSVRPDLAYSLSDNSASELISLLFTSASNKKDSMDGNVKSRCFSNPWSTYAVLQPDVRDFKGEFASKFDFVGLHIYFYLS